MIVDDEPLALDLLESYVERTPFLRLAGRCGNAVGVLSLLRDQPVDVIFLDIQMPGLSGLELSKLIDPGVKVIFTTAFEQYALEGFRVDALDYLLKPVSYPEFLKAANKALEWFETRQPRQAADATPQWMFVKADSRLVKVEYDRILYIEGLKDYVKIYLHETSQPIVSLLSMKALEEMLPPASFIRVHRSYIVNTAHINLVERNRIVFGKTYIPVSDSYKDKFQEFLNARMVK